MGECYAASKETCFHLYVKLLGDKCFAYLQTKYELLLVSFSKIHAVSLGLGSSGKKYLHVSRVTLLLT